MQLLGGGRSLTRRTRDAVCSNLNAFTCEEAVSQSCPGRCRCDPAMHHVAAFHLPRNTHMAAATLGVTRSSHVQYPKPPHAPMPVVASYRVVIAMN